MRLSLGFAKRQLTGSRHTLWRLAIAMICATFLGLTAYDLLRGQSPMLTGPMLAGSKSQDVPDVNSQISRIDFAGRHLFQPASPLPSRRMAEQSVEKIVSRLSLHGVMQLNGQTIVYIQIKGLGLRPFRVGDGVEDMFTVRRIGKNDVELEIVGESIELKL